MSVKFYYASGSPFSWRVWLGLEHKGVPYHQKVLSFSDGDLKTDEYRALNPRRRVPVLVDGDFVLAESSAILEYIEDRWPNGPALFAHEPRKRAIQRRMVREADAYLFDIGTRFIRAPSEESAKELKQELALWEGAAMGDYLTGDLSAVDFTVYPFMALFMRIGGKRPDFVRSDFIGPGLSAWMDRMGALPIVQRTLPPHWKEVAPA